MTDVGGAVKSVEMLVHWPDFTFPPINLYNYPNREKDYMSKSEEVGMGLRPIWKPKADMVTNPAHYTHSKYQTWDVITAWGLGYNLGCVVKYLSRADHKGNRLEDLKKAKAYLDREIELTEE